MSETKKLTIDFGQQSEPAESRHRWMASWLLDTNGMEGDFFYDGPGGSEQSFDVPANAVGFRLRCWVARQRDSTMLPPQYFPAGAAEHRFEAMSLRV